MGGLGNKAMDAMGSAFSSLARSMAMKMAKALGEAAEAADEVTVATSDFRDFARAVSQGDLEGAAPGLQRGFVNKRVPGTSRSTALMQAADAGDLSMIRLLLPESDPSLVDTSGRDALMRAAIAARPAAVKMLALVCNPKLVDNHGDSALSLAAGNPRQCRHEEDLAVIRELLPVSNPLSVNGHGLSAGQCAARIEEDKRAELIDAWCLMRAERRLLAKIAGAAKMGVDAHAPRLRGGAAMENGAKTQP